MSDGTKPVSAVDELITAAMQHHQAGRFAEADRLYRKVLEIDPREVDALHLLGVACCQMGNNAEAIPLIRKSLEIKPSFAEAHNSLGNVLQALGQCDEAILCYKRALTHKKDYADAYSNMANVLKAQGNYEQAVARYRQALRLNPNFVDALANLSSALRVLRQLDEAEQCCRRALHIRPNYVPAHCALALVLREQARLDEAEVCCRKALEISPDSAEASSNLGLVLISLGRLDEAQAACRRALRINPNSTDAYANLTKTRLYNDADSGEIEEMERLVAVTTLMPASRRRLHFALGKVYNDCCKWDRAFSHYTAANKICEFQYDDSATRKGFDATIEVCTRQLLERGPELGSSSELPIFIVGMPRSGTSLVEQILSSHPDVYGAGELTTIVDVVQLMKSKLGADAVYPRSLSRLDSSIAVELADRYLERLRSLGGDASRVIDKMPSNFVHLGFLALILPSARIIHCRRHPLDTCLSCYCQDFNSRFGLSYAFDLRSLGMYYKQYERLMEHWRDELPLRMLEVDYEKLVSDQEQVSRQLVEFCGLQWDPACLDFHNNHRAVHTASHWQVRQPIYSSSVGRWKNYEQYLRPLREALNV